MGIEKDTQINPMDTPWQMFRVLYLLGLQLGLGNQIKRFQYSKTGYRFGFRCRFQHVRENSHSQWPIENEHNHLKTGYNYPLPGVNFASFLGEMRNMIVRTVRERQKFFL